jgi:Permuted papain-like amidase enzyme, YaeF/YiiX, C92 family
VTRRSPSIKNFWKGPALWLVLFFPFAGCEQAETNMDSAKTQAEYQHERLTDYLHRVLPQANIAVHNGDLVLRLGTDITSEMIRQLNKTDASFSHCGIASIENDTVFIYHAIGGEFNPDQQLRRESLYSFCHPADNKAMAIYRPGINEQQQQAMLHTARKYYQRRIPFDMAFDYASEDRLYCAEFVAKCLSRAMADSSWVTFTTAGNFSYITVDNLFTSPVMTEIKRIRY